MDNYFVFPINHKGEMVGNPSPIASLEVAKAQCERLAVGTVYKGTLQSLSTCHLFWFNRAWHTFDEYLDWSIAGRVTVE